MASANNGWNFQQLPDDAYAHIKLFGGGDENEEHTHSEELSRAEADFENVFEPISDEDEGDEDPVLGNVSDTDEEQGHILGDIEDDDDNLE